MKKKSKKKLKKKTKKKLVKSSKGLKKHVKNKRKGINNKSAKNKKGKGKTLQGNRKSDRKVRKKQKRVIHKYDTFVIEFTATRIRYENNADLETFSRVIPVAKKMTTAQFIKNIAPDIVRYEKSVFKKISEDTENAVTWSDWIIHYKHFIEKGYNEYE